MYAHLAIMGLKYCHGVVTHPVTRAAMSTGYTALMTALTIHQADETFRDARTMFKDWGGAAKSVETAARQYLNDTCIDKTA